MEIVIGILIVILILFGIGYFMRKRVYKEVDRLEARKIAIMNRSLADEMIKVKDLKMTGQAEEMFERWREEWDEIITTQLPEVEELLFDAEDYADKYRFKKSKQVLQHIEKVLQNTDQNIDRIISEIHELVSSEEKNSVEIGDLRESFKKAKKTLLAHAHTFGKAQQKLEEKLHEIYEALKQFDVETEAGNYIAAREILILQKEQLDIVCYKIEHIPKLLSECQHAIPAQIHELLEGYREMEEQGYLLSHIQIETELNRISENVKIYLKQIEQTEIEQISEEIQEINESIDTFYDLLEKEVGANQFVRTALGSMEKSLEKLETDRKLTDAETDIVRQSYQLTEQDIEKQKQIGKQISQLQKQYDAVFQHMNQDQVAYSLIKEDLQELDDKIKNVEKEHDAYRQKLQALRKDELQARQKLTEMKRMITESNRLIQKSNIPGLPESYRESVVQSSKAISMVVQKLDEIPLDMVAVNYLLEDAVEAVEALNNKTNDMVEQVYLIEKVIQYGNRFRSRNSGLASSLTEAENLFRAYKYEESLETAAAALEQVDPGSLQRIQNIIDDELKAINP
ncbi:septation ring formation regulator EzrA [Metabacillus lacus]|nr:septation ring formation regulator EzrA [Metabacillus lacus]